VRRKHGQQAPRDKKTWNPGSCKKSTKKENRGKRHHSCRRQIGVGVSSSRHDGKGKGTLGAICRGTVKRAWRESLKIIKRKKGTRERNKRSKCGKVYTNFTAKSTNLRCTSRFEVGFERMEGKNLDSEWGSRNRCSVKVRRAAVSCNAGRMKGGGGYEVNKEQVGGFT